MPVGIDGNVERNTIDGRRRAYQTIAGRYGEKRTYL